MIFTTEAETLTRPPPPTSTLGPDTLAPAPSSLTMLPPPLASILTPVSLIVPSALKVMEAAPHSRVILLLAVSLKRQ